MKATEKPAKVYVYEGGDEYSVMFDGVVQTDDETVHIRYDESPAEHLHFAVLGDIVTVNRVGELTYTLILEKDKPISLPIQTPFGTLIYAVTPKTVRTSASPQAVNIDLNYIVSAGGVETSIDLKLKCELY